MIRNHIAHGGKRFTKPRSGTKLGFELLSPLRLSLFSFRYRPEGIDDEAALDALNKRLIEALNDTGRIYLTQNLVRGRFAIRFQIGQTNTQKHHVDAAWALIKETAQGLDT